ncbi:DNA repair exonuclease SbcCD ATPase subunit [Sphingopyxis sp. YR583]|uniref:AAA family ATPase n=1 Tax=Sphingopyxis sp. YR583 TaxID=1881047 RepID=UPI0008A7E679|nr:AAA family ATPase [Sphingopyxis sp. YR583]SEH15085.1 DNA repair exonuclease SbcCD ATPase subunit [Sphingopyxis sp. YR583]
MMRIHELHIENFRKFRRPLRLDGFEPGINLISDQNEAGKSTVLEALRAVLFERSGSKSERIRSFRPHGDEVAPTVELVFEVAGGRWRLRKRFLQNPSVELEGPSGRATGDDAEDRLQELLGFARAGNRGADDDSRGALGLLWVEQGQSFVIGSPGEGARRTIEEVLAGEIGAVTGGQRTQKVLQSVERSLAELLTATGRPTKRLQAAQDAATSAVDEAQRAQQELEQFDAVLDRLESKRNEQRRLLEELDDPEHEERLRAIEADLDRAKAAGQTLRTAEALLREAAGVRTALEKRQTDRHELRASITDAERTATAAQTAAKEQATAAKEASTAEKEAAKLLETVRNTLREIDEKRLEAAKAHRTRARERALVAAFARLDKAEALSTNLDRRREEVDASRMTPDALRELQALEQSLVEAQAASNAGAALFEVSLQPTAPAATLDGEAVEGEARALVTKPLVLEVEGVGRVAITPPASGEPAQARLRAAEQDLASFLGKMRCHDAEAAREAGRKREEASQAISRLEAQLDASCPEDSVLDIAAGLDALRGSLATESLPKVDDAEAQSQDDELDVIWTNARTAVSDAEGRREAALQTLQDAQKENVRLGSDSERAAADLQRLKDQLRIDLEQVDDEKLGADLAEAKSEEGRATVARDEAKRAVEGLDEAQITQRRDTLRRRRERLAEDRLDLVGEIAQLEERAKTLGGSGPASRAAAAAEMAESVVAAHDKLKEEAATLALLVQTIRDAQREASRRFLTPVTERVAPYIARLLPGATLSFSEDLRPVLLQRGSRSEDTGDLSKGTQEQLAVLTRIAFADLLIEKGKPASLVLDDVLVFADDDRFDTMLEILSDAAKRMQIIILSCRTSAYRGLEAKRIPIA